MVVDSHRYAGALGLRVQDGELSRAEWHDWWRNRLNERDVNEIISALQMVTTLRQLSISQLS